ncbi:uncharacterized protein SPSK_05612 [Sporothrix schenckii 1099-18]|uniref:Uncharacterized protein n=1 Tax=Sporothrix schenckii 1099-18 TaxID=1397361 RepID=A0A0F2LU16_SPOSC|nr:uncharacterized protein SPSK_05612 [Sporothrix schenckii 1099-18]KJR80359.1 hypothetical protein SPSK_05612 [Sporothrix schenckii 1099-18]
MQQPKRKNARKQNSQTSQKPLCNAASHKGEATSDFVFLPVVAQRATAADYGLQITDYGRSDKHDSQRKHPLLQQHHIAAPYPISRPDYTVLLAAHPLFLHCRLPPVASATNAALNNKRRAHQQDVDDRVCETDPSHRTTSHHNPRTYINEER